MRRSLALIATAGLLPIVALSGAFGVATLSSQRAAVRDGAELAVNSIATIASVRLKDGMREVEMIAQSPAFDGPFDAARFKVLGNRLRDTSSHWDILSVADPEGRRILDVPEAIAGVEGGPVVDLASLERTVRTKANTVGNIIQGPRGRYAFAVRAPVIRDGRVVNVVSAVVPAEAAGELLQSRRLPDDWRAGIVDGAGNVVATTNPESQGTGRQASLEGRTARQSGKPGVYETVRADGVRVMVVWAPIAGTDWTAHVSAPAAAYLMPTRGAWTILVAAVLACLALLALLVRLLAIELRHFREREEARVQAQRMEMLGQLTGGVAHDFNNLLMPVMTGLDLLRVRVKDDEKAMRHVNSAMASAERARSLVARLLSFSRKQPLSVQSVDIARLIAELQDLLEQSAGSKVRIDIDIAPDLPPARADASQLELAILNLVINGRDAMPDGGTITIRAKALRVLKAQDLAAGEYVQISVADTGTGMDEATRRQAIDPFFTTKAVDKGTGLGLSMVHGLAAQSGGALRLESAPGEGTKATIVLPRADAGSDVQSTFPAASAQGDRARLMVVDDDPLVRSSIVDMLKESGFHVDDASSVDDALGIIEASVPFDAVITDLRMPERSGADLIRTLNASHPDLPVLLISGYDPRDEEVPASVARLTKPFRADELRAALDTLLRPGAPVTTS